MKFETSTNLSIIKITKKDLNSCQSKNKQQNLDIKADSSFISRIKSESVTIVKTIDCVLEELERRKSNVLLYKHSEVNFNKNLETPEESIFQHLTKNGNQISVQKNSLPIMNFNNPLNQIKNEYTKMKLSELISSKQLCKNLKQTKFCI